MALLSLVRGKRFFEKPLTKERLLLNILKAKRGIFEGATPDYATPHLNEAHKS
jgi:hypothetical protein